MQYRAWQFVTVLVRRLPLPFSYTIAAIAGSAAFYFWPRGRRATVRNFAHVLPGRPAAEVRRVARQSLINYCCYLADFVRFPSLARDEISRSVEAASDFLALDGVLARGKGAIIVCMHFGNWDLGAGAASVRGYPITVVAETFKDPRLDEMVVGARSRLGMRVVKMEKTAPSLVRDLHKNGLLALLIDRPVPGDGVKVQFFGAEVEVPAGPARLALRTGATVVPAAFARVAARRPGVVALTDFDLCYDPTGDERQDVTALTQQIMTAQETFIRRYPEQWYMFREMWPRAAVSARR